MPALQGRRVRAALTGAARSRGGRPGRVPRGRRSTGGQRSIPMAGGARCRSVSWVSPSVGGGPSLAGVKLFAPAFAPARTRHWPGGRKTKPRIEENFPARGHGVSGPYAGASSPRARYFRTVFQSGPTFRAIVLMLSPASSSLGSRRSPSVPSPDCPRCSYEEQLPPGGPWGRRLSNQLRFESRQPRSGWGFFERLFRGDCVRRLHGAAVRISLEH